MFDEYETKMQNSNLYMKEIIETEQLPGAHVFLKKKAGKGK